MKLAIVIGTRPELIKMAPVMRELKRQHIPFTFIHSNQHYSKNLDQNIINNLSLPNVDFHLNVGSGTHAFQTGKIMMGVEPILTKIKPNYVLVHGDTNTTLACALSAVKLHIKVAHIEAGLRSFDYSMPEEVNRMLTDRISDLLFAPSKISQKNLINEGIIKSRIHVTGNTVVDALKQHIEIARTQSNVIEKLKLIPQEFILATAHRPENVDSRLQLEKTIRLLAGMSKYSGMQVVFPIHPRTNSNLMEFGIEVNSSRIRLIEPVNYLDTLALIDSCALVITDSGGLQEEAYVLNTPLITIRTSTERPETKSANFIVGLDLAKAKKAWDQYENNKCKWKETLGDGNAAKKIVAVLKRK